MFLNLNLELDRVQLDPLERKFKSSVRTLMREVAKFWHAEIFPSHFTPGNESRYRFQPRTPRYIARKRKYGVAQGRFVANVFTGDTKRWMTTLAKFRVEQGTNIARVNMPTPTYFRKPYNPKGNQPDKVDEVTQFSGSDRVRVQEFARRRFNEIFKKHLSAAEKAA